MRPNCHLALLLICLLLSACAAAELGLIEEGAVIGEGAEIATGLGEMEAEGGIAARIAAEAAQSGELLAPRGALVRALGEIAESDGVVSIDHIGRISQAGRYLATIESDGTLTAEAGARRLIVGRVAEGNLYEVSRGSVIPVARLRGFVPSRGIRLATAPGTAETSFEVLRNEVAAEILEVRNGWYEIRLPDGTTGWVWGPAIAALLISRNTQGQSSCRCADGAGAVLLKTGEIIPYDSCTEDGSAVTLHARDGRTITIDGSLIDEVLCGNDARIPVSGTRVEMSNGIVIYADSVTPVGSAATIATRDGGHVVVDGDLIVMPPNLFPATTAQAPPSYF